MDRPALDEGRSGKMRWCSPLGGTDIYSEPYKAIVKLKIHN